MYMIILKLKKINTIFKNTINNFLSLSNYGPLECPHCHSNNLLKWGTYERNVIFFSNSNSTSLEAQVVKIQRFKCKACNKTHAILPVGIIPYKQFSDEVISRILYEYLFSTILFISEKYNIDESTINKIIKQFKKYHLSKTSIFTKKHTIREMLKSFLLDSENKINYIKMYNTVFMQIKLGCLGLCPS